MTRLKHYRLKTNQKLREVAEKIGLTPATVHDAEVRGILTPRLAAKYAVAFPGTTWKDLLEPPRVITGKTAKGKGSTIL
ncbi:MAG: helix-turn-helix transcriptional regulator [Lentisphaeria bacterium]|nr:helix-turn-helix transcriptional regulator [Lentisphaeria bacterium]